MPSDGAGSVELAVTDDPPAGEPTAADEDAAQRSLWDRTLESLRGMLAEAKTADWCAVWAGLLCFLALLPLVLTVTDDEQATYRVPQPMKWGSDPFEAWDWYNGAFTWLLLGLLLAIYLLCARLTGKLRKLPTSRYVVGFCAHGALATVCLWFGRNAKLASFGISYAVYAICLGMVLGNGARLSARLDAVASRTHPAVVGCDRHRAQTKRKTRGRLVGPHGSRDGTGPAVLLGSPACAGCGSGGSCSSPD